MPLRCRLFGHDYRDTLTGWRMPDIIVPSVEGPIWKRVYRCTRCPAEKKL